MGKEVLLKTIAGEITLAEEPGKVMRKWREIFGIKQSELASFLKISASVISDYESGRRKSPGIGFVKKFIRALVSHDIKKDNGVIKKFSLMKENAVLDMREFLTSMKGVELLKAVKGKVLSNKKLLNEKIFGYTVIDSIKAILELSEEEFLNLYGLNNERALIFTKVKLGRSPMIAIKVTKPKPKIVVLHGLNPQAVDKLAIKISNLEKIPLIVSTIKEEKELVENLRKLA